jgi:hypothetical protein
MAFSSGVVGNYNTNKQGGYGPEVMLASVLPAVQMQPGGGRFPAIGHG